MKMTTYILRIAICAILGTVLCMQGLGMLNSTDLYTQILAPIPIGFGMLIVIYGFSPSVASEIIKAIVKIVALPFKAIFH